MRRNNLFKTILIVIFILLALWKLYPTYKLQQLKDEATVCITNLENLTGIPADEIQTAFRTGNLDRVIRNAMKGSSEDSLMQAIEWSDKLHQIDEKIARNEVNAIQLGLDLQGGTYLVYETDFPLFVSNIARNKDARFEKLVQETDIEAKRENRDFFDVFLEKFQEANIPLNRYFGKLGQPDDRIISDLRKESEEAVGRSLEVLRNRIDQFGVSEPSIQKQGSRRIVVELAGIQDIGRAKAIIGKTALLEFKLVKDWDVTWSVIRKIDGIVKRIRQPIANADTAQKGVEDTTRLAQDTTEAKPRVRESEEVDLAELFGETEKTEVDTSESDTASLSVDKGMFEENPFIALLGNIGNRMAVPKQNMAAVERILNMPEVEEVIPKDSEFLWHQKPVRVRDEEWYYLYLVRKDPELTGKLIDNADVQIAGASGGRGLTGAGQPKVSLRLNSEGAKIFRRVTGANVGKQLAIVLDGKVASAPNIREKIPSGNAEIDGMADINEAKDLVTVLRAGALPARLESIEERTVGPSLGQDSIHKGQWSAIVGLILVMVFMIVYYRMSGLIADLALVLNIIFILAVLAGFHATLTLPGIAGIILTIGMAVDANVLIFERIREELRTGKTIRAAIDSGYARAFKTILDANVTTLLTALVLYQFGTGPIRGFALTLSIGIIASMFTAIVVTRVIFDFITNRWIIQKLSI